MHASMLSDIEQTRFNMIEQQIRPWGVLDETVLASLFNVPRENFVPHDKRAMAFYDLELPLIIDGIDTCETMLSPRVEARLAQDLQLTTTDCVLEIGTGSGYQAALIANLAQQVTTIEINSHLATFAKNNLQRNYVTNVKVEIGDGHNGWGSIEYDAILVSSSVPVIPEALKYQLHIGGRMVIVVGQAPIMTAVRITRCTAVEFKMQSLFDIFIKTLHGASISQFSF